MFNLMNYPRGMITSLGLVHNDLMLTARIILINLEEERMWRWWWCSPSYQHQASFSPSSVTVISVNNAKIHTHRELACLFFLHIAKQSRKASSASIQKKKTIPVSELKFLNTGMQTG